MFIGTSSRWDLSILTGQKISMIGFNSQRSDWYRGLVTLCLISLSPHMSLMGMYLFNYDGAQGVLAFGGAYE